MASDYCGCCGRECVGEWCDRCREHVIPAKFGRHAWERTYYAQYHRDCPYQIRDNEKFTRSNQERIAAPHE